MSDEIRQMSAQLASEPDSLVFSALGEALRRAGQLEAAAKVALGGLERHPDLVDGKDLYARILVDMDEPERAAELWAEVVAQEPRHAGARKGLGFVCYRAGDLERALEHLEMALSADPADRSVVQALRTVRGTIDEAELAPVPEPPAPNPAAVFEGLEGADHGLLLVDDRGRILGGGLRAADGRDVAAAVAAYLAGAAQEAERTARLLGLGAWRWLVAEGPSANLYVTQPKNDALLLLLKDRSVPAGRLTRIADRAADIARAWLEAQER